MGDDGGGGRRLASVLFTDLENSTGSAARLGDKRWRAVLDAHDALAQELVRQHEGSYVNSTGDGLVAVFDSPGQAVRCALALIEQMAAKLDLQVRAGVHSGECEFRTQDVSGIAVHVAARVCAAAAGGQLLVSRTVRDLVAGDGLQYVAAGVHSLKGVPGRWSLYEVATSAPPKQRPTKKTMPRRAAEPKARKAISVVVVDDHPLWRQTLRSVVESDGAAKVVAEASDGSEAAAVIADARPDVVLMDMDMPSMHGVDATAAVVAAVPSTKVLVLSASDDPDVVLAAVRAGASGYLLKTADGAEIRTALLRVAAGELAFPSQLSEVVLQGLRQPPPGAPGDSGLTARELEVLDLMAEGLSNQAIGKRLFLSGKTVEAHVSTIFTKLGIEPTDDVNRRVRAVVAHLSTRHAAARARGSSRGHP